MNMKPSHTQLIHSHSVNILLIWHSHIQCLSVHLMFIIMNVTRLLTFTLILNIQYPLAMSGVNFFEMFLKVAGNYLKHLEKLNITLNILRLFNSLILNMGQWERPSENCEIVIFEFKLEYSNLKFEYELEYSNLEFEYELEYSNSNSNIAISRFFRWTLSICGIL